MSRPVVLSGLGCVGPYGIGPLALERAAREGQETVDVDRSAGHHRPGAARRALLATADLGALVAPSLARRMSPPARLAVAAARLALADAGLEALEPAGHGDTAVVVGTAFGPASVTEKILAQIFGQGPENVSPALFTESVASASAAQIAIVFKARGASIAVTEREASDLLALGAGARLVATGAAARALVVVVEPAESAAARGHAPLARITALVRAFDPSAAAWDYGRDDESLARSLRRGLDRAGCEPGSIGLVVSGASGALAGDRLEAAVLRRLFPAGPPPVVAPKGALGGWGGGHLAAAVLAASGRAFAPAGDGSEPDPALGVRLAREVPRSPARVLVSSLGSGGAAGWAVLDRGQPDLPPGV